MYTTPLGNIFRKHGLNFHLYADDIQLYISFQPGVSVSKETAISCLEACIKDIRIWMTNNLLNLNDDKTELMVITTHSNTSQNQHIGINIGNSLITPSSEPPRNLLVLFDPTCSLNDYVSKICKSVNYNLYSIRKIQKYLDTPTAEKMMKLFYNITNGLLLQSPLWCNRLQYIPDKALAEQCRPDVVLAPQIRSYHPSSERPTLAVCWAKNRIQGPAAHL